MRGVIRVGADAVMPSDADVLMRVGVPAWAAPTDAVMDLLRDARWRVAQAANPRGVVQRISAAQFLDIYRGEGRNSAETPLGEIVPRAGVLALFVGTIGARVEEQIAALFGASDPALAVMVDAFASEMTNGVANELAVRLASEIGGDTRVLPYSPGYCGWHVSGQRALFAAIRPADIGVTLNESCLMAPLKSVSGVLVAGDANIHRFRPQWTFCEECAGKECGPRMASVR